LLKEKEKNINDNETAAEYSSLK